MEDLHSDSEILSKLAHDYTERLRRGERLSIQQFADAHPALATQIEDLFPTLLLLEQIQESENLSERGTTNHAPADYGMPDRLGDYRLVRLVGAGGMGRVFEAVQDPLGRRVALKVLAKHYSDQRLSERFAREAKVVARLHHNNVVPVFGFGDDQGFIYYAMQLIEGRSLDHYLRASKSTAADADTMHEANVATPARATHRGTGSSISDDGWRTILGVSNEEFFSNVALAMAQIADALAHAHGAGIIHRDLKPSNLLLDRRGALWITDFGLAELKDASDITLTHEILGTLRYMPPERFQGKCDVRSDIYSFGATLYEILAQQPAFGDVDRAKVIKRIMCHSFPSLRTVVPTIPRDLATIVHKAMARDPSDRYQTASELADDLLRFSQDRPIHARRQMMWEHLWRWSRHNRALAFTGGLALLAILGVAIVSSLAYQREKQIRTDLYGALERVQATEVQRRNDLFQSHLATAKAAQLSRQRGQRFESLLALRKASTLLPSLGLPAEQMRDHRNEIRDLAVSSLGLPDIRDLGDLPAGVTLDSFHLDRTAHRDASGTLVILQWPGGQELSKLPNVGPDADFCFTPDQDQLLLLEPSANKLYQMTISRATTSFVATSGEPGSELRSWGFSRDGRRLMLSHQVGQHRLVEVIDWPSGEWRMRRKLPFAAASLTVVGRLSPDGSCIATIEGSYETEDASRVLVTDLETGREIATLRHDSSVESLAWHPDSETLVVGLADSNDIVEWNVRQGRQIRVLQDQRGGGPRLCINSTGDLMSSFSSWSNRLELRHPFTGGPLLSISSSTQFEWGTCDGKLLGDFHTTNGDWHFSVAEPSPVVRTLARDPKEGTGEAWRDVSIHPAGRLLAVGSDRGVWLFDLLTGRNVGHLPVGYAFFPWFIPENGDLLTYSEQGLLRWPVRAVDQSSMRMSIGPPTTLPLPSPPTIGTQVASDRTGRVIAVAAHQRAVILHDFGQRTVVLDHLADCRRVAVSHNGQWVVTANHTEGPIEVWDSQDGRPIRRLEERLLESSVCFSPDDQRLALLNRVPPLIRTETWQPAQMPEATDPRFCCFSRDGQLAIDMNGGVTLREFPSGRKLAKLSLPDLPTIWHATFTPDGLHVVLSSNDRQVCYVWNLRELGTQLAEWGCGWDSQAISLSPPSRSNAIPRPLSVQIKLVNE